MKTKYTHVSSIIAAILIICLMYTMPTIGTLIAGGNLAESDFAFRYAPAAVIICICTSFIYVIAISIFKKNGFDIMSESRNAEFVYKSKLEISAASAAAAIIGFIAVSSSFHKIYGYYGDSIAWATGAAIVIVLIAGVDLFGAYTKYKNTKKEEG